MFKIIASAEKRTETASIYSKPLAIVLLALALLAQQASADDKSINSIIGDKPVATAPLHKTPASQKEVWVKGKNPIDHLHIIGAHPLPGETCQQVIFDARPSVKSRHEAKSSKNASFDIKSLCLLGLRNGSDDRAFVIRLGEAFETIAISPDPDLFTGMIIEPHQQIIIPIRPLKVGILNVPIELTWKADLDKNNPVINKTTITINAGK